MKRITLPLVLVAVFLIAAFNVLGQEQAPAPSFKDGDLWQFKSREWDWLGQSTHALDGIYELVYSQGGVKVFRVTGDQREELEASRYGILLALLGQSNTFQDLKFPLSVGQKWNYEYRARARGARRELNRFVEIRVTGIENVTTPAGTFRAFKLEKDNRASATAFSVTTYYYSPETKSVVKSYYDSSVSPGGSGKREIELIKFGSAP